MSLLPTIQTSRQPQHWGEKTPAYTQGDQVENFVSYQTHAKSPPSYQQCMMMLSLTIYATYILMLKVKSTAREKKMKSWEFIEL